MDDVLLRQHREFLKDSLRKEVDFSRTDQQKGLSAPPIEKPFDGNAPRIGLPPRDQWSAYIAQPDLVSAMSNRKSRRRFSSSPLSLAELSFLLWSTQGIRRVVNPAVSLRTVPSAGARHSFETYIFAGNVEGVETGLYRFLPVEEEILFLGPLEDMGERLTRACFGQRFVGAAAATFVWTTIPYRMEWRYSLSAHRVILMDVGHVCQNLYLACEAIGAGTCAVAAYDQEAMDRLIGVDGWDEFAVYLAPVGKV
ncbi:MAG: SagB/ThcOx family dehydrogenase [bacterium]|nr:MAG: SagB/ThcOx family dehydrogenase [bacterium]